MKYSLPDSATDLLIKDGKLLMRTLSIYEIFRKFSHILYLTPFRFEDFTAALLADDQSPLLAEIHIQLLRALIREDRQQQTWLGPPDIRDAVNLYLHSADHYSWPAALRIYLSAEPYANEELLNKMGGHYPFEANFETRLYVFEQLCDYFLLSNLAREEIVNGNSSIGKHDNMCRSCSKSNGDLIPCGYCSAIYHLKCSDPPLDDYPSEKAYMCAVCRSNHLIGVTDCKDQEERSGNLKRHESLGMDKLGRRYWFVVRRLFVVDETEDDVRYYTKIDQFREIIDSLHENRFEKSLIDNLLNQQTEIERQMQITEDLYTAFKKDTNSNSTYLGQDGAHKNYVNHYSNNSLAVSKNAHSDREAMRSMNNKFCMTLINSFKWFGAIDGKLTTLTVTLRTTILKIETLIPHYFVHPCWRNKRADWIKSVNTAIEPKDYAKALSQFETCIKPVFFKAAWFDSLGFNFLFRSTFAEREELRKTDRQPRGFERKEWFVQDLELSQKLGTMVKFSKKLKPVKHQVWKQKGEEYRVTGLNGWYWRSNSHRSRLIKQPKEPKKSSFELPKPPPTKKIITTPMIQPCHDFSTKRSKVKSILVLPEMEIHKLARCGGMRETRSFNYTAKQSNYVWPYGVTPRPSFRTCWLYRNTQIDTLQDVALQLKVLYGCIRWDDLQVRAPASGTNVITTDDATITIEVLKKRDRLPYLLWSEYMIKKTITPIQENPTKYRKSSYKRTPVISKATPSPSARSGLRVRRQTEEEEEKGPTTEMVWVLESQLELWEIKQFEERVERQRQLLREKAIRDESEKKRRAENERRRKADQERRQQRLEAEAKLNKTAPGLNTSPQVKLAFTNGTASAPGSPANAPLQPRTQPTTPVLRYFRTDQGQIIRLPASYLQRGTPLILRHVTPGTNQTSTYIIRPLVTPMTSTANILLPVAPQATSATGTPLIRPPVPATSGPSIETVVGAVVEALVKAVVESEGAAPAPEAPAKAAPASTTAPPSVNESSAIAATQHNNGNSVGTVVNEMAHD